MRVDLCPHKQPKLTAYDRSFTGVNIVGPPITFINATLNVGLDDLGPKPRELLGSPSGTISSQDYQGWQ